MAAVDVQILKYAREVGVGDVRIYKVTLSDGGTSFDLASVDTGTADASWSVVYSASGVASASCSGVGEVYFDGTSVHGAGYTANSTVYVKVCGKHG